MRWLLLKRAATSLISAQPRLAGSALLPFAPLSFHPKHRISAQTDPLAAIDPITDPTKAFDDLREADAATLERPEPGTTL